METKKRNNVLEFYRNIWVPNLTKETELTDRTIEIISKTDSFAKWMMANKYKEVVESVKDTIYE